MKIDLSVMEKGRFEARVHPLDPVGATGLPRGVVAEA
jgi:hypothetical protein